VIINRLRSPALAALAFAVWICIQICQAQQPQPSLACDDRQVLYHAPDSEFDRRIKIVMSKERAPEASKKEISPQGTHYVVHEEPDFRNARPWTSNVVVGRAHVEDKIIKISFIEHGNGGVQTYWINDKLLFLQVWWGRLLSTDLVLDVDQGVFLYREEAYYGEMIQPCPPSTFVDPSILHHK